MNQLAYQIVLGGGMVGLCTAIQAGVILLSMFVRPRLARHVRIGVPVAMITIMVAGALWMLVGITAGVYLWAGALLLVGAFPNFETSLYFALASYTTLGFGDVLPPDEWRVFGAMIAANGMLGFGLATAALVEFFSGIHRLAHQIGREQAAQREATPQPQQQPQQTRNGQGRC